MGVLQRDALCYLFTSVIFLTLKTRKRIFLTILLPVFYWMLMTLVSVPGYGIGILEKEGNLAAYIDNLLLRGHLYAGTWDPEGLLSTIPAIATALIGVLAGEYLRSNHSPREKQ